MVEWLEKKLDTIRVSEKVVMKAVLKASSLDVKMVVESVEKKEMKMVAKLVTMMALCLGVMTDEKMAEQLVWKMAVGMV